VKKLSVKLVVISTLDLFMSKKEIHVNKNVKENYMLVKLIPESKYLEMPFK